MSRNASAERGLAKSVLQSWRGSGGGSLYSGAGPPPTVSFSACVGTTPAAVTETVVPGTTTEILASASEPLVLPPPQLSIVSPIKCVKNEIHNILTVLKFAKQFISPNRFRTEVMRDDENPLVQSFQRLFDSLTCVNEFDVDETHLQPFIDVIESPDTAGPITAVALAAVNKFVVYGLIHPGRPSTASSINRLAGGILNARFQASVTPSDEVVMLKILTVLIDILRCPAGEFLTDEVVWQMVKKAYQISRQPQASYLLRSSSENILQQMVLTIFGCHRARNEHLLERPNDEHPQRLHAIAEMATSDACRPYGVHCMFKTLKFLAFLTSYGARCARTLPRWTFDASSSSSSSVLPPPPPTAAVTTRQNRLRSKTPPCRRQHRSSTPAATHRPPSGQSDTGSSASLSLDPSLDTSQVAPTITTTGESAAGGGIATSTTNVNVEDDLALPFVNPSDDTPEFCEEMRALGLSLLNVALETGGAEVAKCPILLSVIQDEICKSLLMNARTESLLILSITLRCVFNLFVYLKQHLKVQLEVFFNSIHLSIASASESDLSLPVLEQRELALESLLEFCREPDLMVELYENYDCDVHCTNLFERLVIFLCQSSVPAVLRSAMARPSVDVKGPIATDESAQPAAIAATTLSAQRLLSSTTRRPAGFPKLARPIIQKGSVQAATAAPPVLTTLHRLALSGLLAVIYSIASRCRYDATGSATARTTATATTHYVRLSSCDEDVRDASKKPYSTDEKRQAHLREQKEWKRRCELGAELFNTEPDRCISSLQSLGLVSVPVTPSSMADFLRKNPALEMSVVGEYLGGPGEWNCQVREAFLKTFTFRRMCVLDALKTFLSTFRLPGEAQQIERIVETFANHFFDGQPIPLNSVPHLPEEHKPSVSVSDATSTATLTTSGDTETGNEKGPRGVQENRLTRLYTPRWVATERACLISDKHSDISGETDHFNDASSEAQSKDALKSSAEHTSEVPAGRQQEWELYPEDCPPPGAVLIRNVDTIFILSYSIIMLNTDLHNSQVKHKMKPEEFIRNNRGIDAGNNLPPDYLLDLYDCVRSCPLRLCLGEEFPGRALTDRRGLSQADEEYWERVLSKQNVIGPYSSNSLQRAGIHERDMYTVLMQAGSVEAILSCFEATQDIAVMNACLSGILQLGHIAGFYSQHASLSLLLSALAPHVNYWLTLRAQLVIPAMLQLITEGWLIIVELLLKLLSLGLLPSSMTELDDFPEPLEGKPLQRLAVVCPPPLKVRISKQFYADLTSPENHEQGNNSWLSSIATLLFSNDASEDREEGASTSGTYCLFKHSGHLMTADGRAVPIEILRSSDSSHENPRPWRTGAAAGLPGASTQTFSVSYSLGTATKSLLESPSPYFAIRSKLVEKYRVDEMFMERFRRLPLSSLVALVTALIAVALPTTVRAALEPANVPSSGALADDGSSLPAQSELSRLRLPQPNSDVQQPNVKQALPSVAPNIPSILDFRSTFDPLFILELLTNVTLVRLHADDIAASSPTRFTSHETYNSPQQHQQPVDGATAQSRFQTILWPVIARFFDTALRWFLLVTPNQSLPFAVPDTVLERCFAELKAVIADAVTLHSLFHVVTKMTFNKNRLEKSDLMFAERIIVSVLRLCVRLSHMHDAQSRDVLTNFLRLLAHLQPALIALHDERITAAVHQLFIDSASTVSECYSAATAVSGACSGRTLRQLKVTGIDATIVAILTVCQRCAPLKLHPFVLQSSAQSIGSSQALSGAILDILELWLKDLGVALHVLLPDDNGVDLARGRSSYRPSSLLYNVIQTFLLFILPCVNKSSVEDASRQSDVGRRAFDILLSLFQHVFNALREPRDEPTSTVLSPSGQVTTSMDDMLPSFGQSTASTDVEPGASERLWELQLVSLVQTHWELWLFPCLHTVAICAAHGSSMHVRMQALGVLKEWLNWPGLRPTTATAAPVDESSVNSFAPRLRLHPRTWNVCIMDLLLLPLITYNFSYPCPAILQSADSIVLEPVDVWQSEPLAAHILSPASARAGLGLEEVTLKCFVPTSVAQMCRRKAQSIGLVSHVVLGASENLLTDEGELLGDTLCAVATKLFYVIAVSSWFPSAHLYDACEESLKNNVLVLMTTLAQRPEFEHVQAQLSMERFTLDLPAVTTEAESDIGPILAKSDPGRVLPPLPDDAIEILRIRERPCPTHRVLELVLAVLRRASRLEMFETILTAVAAVECSLFPGLVSQRSTSQLPNKSCTSSLPPPPPDVETIPPPPPPPPPTLTNHNISTALCNRAAAVASAGSDREEDLCRLSGSFDNTLKKDEGPSTADGDHKTLVPFIETYAEGSSSGTVAPESYLASTNFTETRKETATPAAFQESPSPPLSKPVDGESEQRCVGEVAASIPPHGVHEALPDTAEHQNHGPVSPNSSSRPYVPSPTLPAAEEPLVYPVYASEWHQSYLPPETNLLGLQQRQAEENSGSDNVKNAVENTAPSSLAEVMHPPSSLLLSFQAKQPALDQKKTDDAEAYTAAAGCDRLPLSREEVGQNGPSCKLSSSSSPLVRSNRSITRDSFEGQQELQNTVESSHLSTVPSDHLAGEQPQSVLPAMGMYSTIQRPSNTILAPSLTPATPTCHVVTTPLDEVARAKMYLYSPPGVVCFDRLDHEDSRSAETDQLFPLASQLSKYLQEYRRL